MLIVAITLVVVAATAAVVIRDAHPRPDNHVPEMPAVAAEAAQPLVLEMPLSPPVAPEPVDADVDAPTQSMPAPLAFTGSQAPALLPYDDRPQQAPEPQPPVRQPAAFVPAGTAYLQPDPDHLIQHEVVIDTERERSAAMTKLVIGIAVSGAAIGVGLVAIGRGIDALIRVLLG